MVRKYDYLIIGSGVAGMSFALKVAKTGTVALVCKSKMEEANTDLAQGGVATVTNMEVDNFDKHIHDTMVAGDWLNDPEAVKKVVTETADRIIAAAGSDMHYKVGTMIEIPRAALTADEIAKEAEFFSFGTNDLTQMTFGFSRDDAGKFLGSYYDNKIYESDPFARLDQVGVGKLVEMACKLGRATRPDLHLGICGEHGGDPSSVEFCHKVGLDYVSCSPFRVPIARLAAAQAAIKDIKSEEEKKAAVVAELEEKIAGAKAALKEASEKISTVASDATDDVMDFITAGLKSLKAGWEEAKKTFGEEQGK